MNFKSYFIDPCLAIFIIVPVYDRKFVSVNLRVTHFFLGSESPVSFPYYVRVDSFFSSILYFIGFSLLLAEIG